MPLLRLDFGALYNKYYGETVRNLRDALQLADMMWPCVLWLDEIEKGVAVGRDDSGIAGRLLGTLPTWMAERTSRAFIVATSNDISNLPPELLRKGRLDEIFRIHMEKRQLDPADFDLAQLSERASGFSGAEIEQVVVSAMYSAAAAEDTLTQAELEASIAGTNRLSIVMREDVASLRVWAAECCILA